MSMNYGDRTRSMRLSGHWQDWANLILALCLFFSPWILGFAMPSGAGGAAWASNASWDSWTLGVIIFAVSATALFRLQAWEEWVNVVLGIWLLLAPFLLGFTTVPGGAWTHWIVGALVVIFAVWDLQSLRGRSMHRPLRQH
jgi:hypothetical protein